MIYWIRRDFRLKDNLALQAAKASKEPILLIYIFSPEEESSWGQGAASRWWLHHSLTAFEKELKSHGLKLWIFQGDSLSLLQKLLTQTGSSHLVFNRLYEPKEIHLEKKVVQMAQSQGCLVEGFSGDMLFAPGSILNGQGNPYTVFTPFWKTAGKEEVRVPHQTHYGKIPQQSIKAKGLTIEDLNLLPKIHWDKEFYKWWEPGERGAWKRLTQFKSKALSSYVPMRDFPAEEGTSLLSPHLHFGEITSSQVWYELVECKKADVFLRQIGWREFAKHLLIAFPKTPLHPLRQEYEKFPWKKNATLFHLWCKGETGIPIVDAGMRQLWKTGWMHNRLRMIVGSFLVKDLMIPWQEGAKWFWDTLVDADLANNTLGWQWVGGCGADAAPYFRIFNPVTQGEKFDPEGTFVREYVPELEKMPAKWIHKPHLAPEEVLFQAGVSLGDNYPHPIVDHDIARKSALEIYSKWTKGHK